eukprot:CAMPEP_0181224486 /NCGR_PEP_ID=MMETSP1096-20121128/31154_1 /TAXON_ID=156174 ORGANISM="Chrysochromulina ericina, Strain CCMP281" /NCGR_SAMPLE_ID=MMETSP1096 /ASSEMBLY_ACC=CAM_ASM_000453 /LENGTH=107 /DNA_ID=CAMNT_0023317575 /DNA_START=601 /DNA_END=925 /DNA_ORIENTATION=-
MPARGKDVAMTEQLAANTSPLPTTQSWFGLAAPRSHAVCVADAASETGSVTCGRVHSVSGPSVSKKRALSAEVGKDKGGLVSSRGWKSPSASMSALQWQLYPDVASK